MNCTSWPQRRMRIIDRHRQPQRRRTLCAALAFALILATGAAARAQAAPVRYTFAVIADTLQSPADEASTQRLIDAIGRDRDMSFIVYDGNLKGAKETCGDTLYDRRQSLLEAARPALIFIPGQHDWTDCGIAAAGGFDPVERLDQLRQTIFADTSSLGQNPLALTRESEVSRFRPYRENVRWQLGDTVFIGLNVPGSNNHYLSAGGRNGEFEDRVIANAFWLEHAAEYAKRREARAIVVFIQGDPDPERYERPDRFAWLRFGRNSRRDGFLELKRSFVKAAQIFHGPIVLIHNDDGRPAGGFTIDQPLRNDKGEVVTNLTRIAFAPHDRLDEWLQIDADLSRRPPFRVSMHEVPKNLPLVPFQPASAVQPAQAPDETGPGLSAPPGGNQTPGQLPDQSPAQTLNQTQNQTLNQTLNPASNLPPLLPTTPQPQQPLNALPGSSGEAPAPTGASAGAQQGMPPGMPASSVQRGP